ncbi:MAG: arylsulfatase [Bacteroidota bacterium]
MKYFRSKKIWIYCGISLCLRILVACSPQKEQESNRPNIILILADDMGYSDLGCYGSEINTPSLDNLAANGLLYTQFYNAARCCPSRASLLTGLYPHQTGFGLMDEPQYLPGYTGELSANSVTLAEVLRDTGYSTYATGKWHLTHNYGQWKEGLDTSKINWPLQRGFDKFYGTIIGAGSYFDPKSLVYDNTPLTLNDPKYYYTDAITDTTISFLKSHLESKIEEPFFCYVAYTAPHWPLHALSEDIKKYAGMYDVGWDTIRQKRYEKMLASGIIEDDWELSPRNEEAIPWKEADDKEWRTRCMEVYAAQVDRMDQGIGKLVKTLEEAGELDNTIIIFLSDNGADKAELYLGFDNILVPDTTLTGKPVRAGNYRDLMPGPDSTYQSAGREWANVSNAPFRYFKMNTYEGGTSTPLIVHWPAGIESKGGLRKQMGHIIDIMPTFMEVSGAIYPESRDTAEVIPYAGKSLVPTFTDKPLERDYLAWEHLSNRGIIMGEWKLVSFEKDLRRYWEDGRMKFEALSDNRPWELYNLYDDRTEVHNLAGKYPEKVDEMAAQWEEWAKRVHVKPWPY